MTKEKKLSSRVKSLRGDLSFRAFGEKCGISDGSVRNMESGKDVSMNILKKVASACGVTTSWLIGDSNQSTTASVTGTNNTTIQTTNHRGDVVTNQPTANQAQEKTVQLSDQEAELILLMREYMSPAERRALLDDLREKEERYR